MTNEEFSNEFDILLNSLAYVASFGDLDSPYSIELDEYEKSVFLTRAQEELIKGLYITENTGISFEANEKIRRQLESLVKQYIPSANVDDSTIKLTDLDKYKHTTYTLPNKCWFIVYEQVKQTDDTDNCVGYFVADVTPITHDDYWRVRNNPFRGPTKKRVLRLDNYDNTVELVSKYTIDEYLIRYIEKPTPIVLEDLPAGLSIETESEEKECKLHSSLHHTILELAVQLAVQAKQNSVKTSEKSGDKEK